MRAQAGQGVKIRFGDFRLDTDVRTLIRGANQVSVSPKAFELLKVLVENRHRAVSKAELLKLVWPGVFVSDASLARVVSELRDAIDDRGHPARIVRTVRSYGYAFAAEAKEESPPLAASVGQTACWLTVGGRTIPLADGKHIAGRDLDSSIWLDSPRVSRRHARIIVEAERATIEDLGSKNGTFLRSGCVEGATMLQPGDTIRIGPFTLTFNLLRGTLTTESEIGSAETS